MLNRLALAIVHRYPVPWRERYEAEVLSLIEDSPVRFSDLGELVRGLIVERARALIEDAEHPRRTATILGSVQPLCIVVVVACAWSLGTWLRGGQPLAASVGVASQFGWMIVFGPVLLVRSYRVGKNGGARSGPRFTSQEALALLPILFVVMVLIEWSLGPSVSRGEFAYWRGVSIRNFVHGCFAGVLLASLMPGRRFLRTLGDLAKLDQRISFAQAREDRAAVDQLRRERDQVMTHLQSLGYRARFRA